MDRRFLTESPTSTDAGLLEVDAQRIGVTLTEHYAMTPAASVSGFYYSHPDAEYFGIGKIQRDQVESIAARKGVSVAEMERWLAPVLGYEPELPRAANA